MEIVTFVACVTLLCTHEVDAVYRKEWTLLPFLRGLKPDLATQLFIAIHVPIFAILFWALTPSGSGPLRAGIAILSIIHTALHCFWPRSPLYLFDNLWSRIWIWGAGIAGLLYLVTSQRPALC